MASMVVQIIGLFGHNVLYAMAKLPRLGVINVVEGVLNLVLSMIFAHFMGIVGVALGTALPLLFFRLIVVPLYVVRLVGLSLRQYYATLGPTCRVRPPGPTVPSPSVLSVGPRRGRDRHSTLCGLHSICRLSTRRASLPAESPCTRPRGRTTIGQAAGGAMLSRAGSAVPVDDIREWGAIKAQFSHPSPSPRVATWSPRLRPAWHTFASTALRP